MEGASPVVVLLAYPRERLHFTAVENAVGGPFSATGQAPALAKTSEINACASS